MTTTMWVWGCVYCLLIGFGVGQRVAVRYMRKQAKRMHAEFMAKADALDAAITDTH